jgi:hypothetical protein
MRHLWLFFRQSVERIFGHGLRAWKAIIPSAPDQKVAADDSLAKTKAHEATDAQGVAEFLAFRREKVDHRHGRVFDEALLEQAALREEFLQPLEKETYTQEDLQNPNLARADVLDYIEAF